MTTPNIMRKSTIFVVCMMLLVCIPHSNGRTISSSNDSAATSRQPPKEEIVFYEILRFMKASSSELPFYQYSYATSYDKNTLNPHWVG